MLPETMFIAVLKKVIVNVVAFFSICWLRNQGSEHLID